MTEIRKVEPVEKVVNQKEYTEPYVKEEKIENEPNNFGTMLKEEQQRLREEEYKIRRRQLENEKEYYNLLRDEYRNKTL